MHMDKPIHTVKVHFLFFANTSALCKVIYVQKSRKIDTFEVLADYEGRMNNEGWFPQLEKMLSEMLKCRGNNFPITHVNKKVIRWS